MVRPLCPAGGETQGVWQEEKGFYSHCTQKCSHCSVSECYLSRGVISACPSVCPQLVPATVRRPPEHTLAPPNLQPTDKTAKGFPTRRFFFLLLLLFFFCYRVDSVYLLGAVKLSVCPFTPSHEHSRHFSFQSTK